MTSSRSFHTATIMACSSSPPHTVSFSRFLYMVVVRACINITGTVPRRCFALGLVHVMNTHRHMQLVAEQAVERAALVCMAHMYTGYGFSIEYRRSKTVQIGLVCRSHPPFRPQPCVFSISSQPLARSKSFLPPSLHRLLNGRLISEIANTIYDSKTFRDRGRGSPKRQLACLTCHT